MTPLNAELEVTTNENELNSGVEKLFCTLQKINLVVTDLVYNVNES